MCEKCTGTEHDWDHCRVEKMGCPGCSYYKKEGGKSNEQKTSEHSKNKGHQTD